MIFIIRTTSGEPPPFDIKMTRKTPAIVPNSANHTDYFCLGDPAAAPNHTLVHDGWYADDHTGGMAIWGQGMFWEVRDTPFTIKQACGPEAWPADLKHDQEAAVNVRRVIFQG
jgi:hypothetical protein